MIRCGPGRFPISQEECRAIVDLAREPLDGIKPALPVVGGGVDVERVPHWLDEYGTDVMFLIGTSLYAQGDVQVAAERLRASVDAYLGEKVGKR